MAGVKKTKGNRSKTQKRGRTPRTELTKQYLKMIDHYMEFGVKKAAVEHAGFKWAASYQWRLFNRPEVKAEIARRQAVAQRVSDLDEGWVINRLMRLADANPGQIMEKLKAHDYDLGCLNEDEQYCLAEFTEELYVEGRGADAETVKKVRLKVEARLNALTALCRKLGLFNDKLELSGDLSLVERLQAGRNRAAQRNKKEDGDDGSETN